MFQDFSKKKTGTFILITGMITLGIIITISKTNVLDKNFLSSNLTKTKFQFDRMVYEFNFSRTNGRTLFGSIGFALGFNNDRIYSFYGSQAKAAKSVPVLLYHSVVKKNPDEFNVLEENFEAQMIALKKNGWQTVSIEDFYKFLKGEIDLPDKSFLLTFDDGRKESYYPVDPILKVLDFKAINFIITGRSLDEKDQEHPYTLSDWEIKEMLKTGRWEIQSHGQDDHELYSISQNGDKIAHFLSNRLWLESENRLETESEAEERIRNDLTNAKMDLENQFNLDIFAFAFPFGDFGQDSINFPNSINTVPAITSSIYSIAFHQFWEGIGDSFNYPSKDKFFLVKRTIVPGDWTASDLLKDLDNGRAKDIPFSDDFTQNNGWMASEGELRIENNYMVLRSSDNRSSGTAFLDGSYLWKNYSAEANIILDKGYSFSLLANYKDDSNYIACIFSPDYIRVEQSVNGVRTVLANSKGNRIDADNRYKITVNRAGAGCFVNGEAKIGANLNYGLPPNGGIALRSWDSTPDNSQITVHNLVVKNY